MHFYLESSEAAWQVTDGLCLRVGTVELQERLEHHEHRIDNSRRSRVDNPTAVFDDL